jgi:hypothetical protein
MSQQTLSDPPREAGKLFCAHYLASAHWERRKDAYYANHPRVCRACKSTKDVHLRHHTYERLGTEFDTDLVSLCDRCHVLVCRYHREHGGSLTVATRHVLQRSGTDLDPPCRRVKGRKFVKPARIYPDKKVPKDQLAQAFKDEANAYRRLSAPKVGFADVIEEFGVTKQQLRFQGYAQGVLLSTVQGWRKERPTWMT